MLHLTGGQVRPQDLPISVLVSVSDSWVKMGKYPDSWEWNSPSDSTGASSLVGVGCLRESESLSLSPAEGDEDEDESEIGDKEPDMLLLPALCWRRG